MQVIQFKTTEEFIAELREEAAQICDKMVRWQLNRTPEQAEQVTFQVDVWATCLRIGGEADYLYEFGNVAGCDNTISEDPVQQTAGTDTANAWKAKLADACDDLGLKFRPGKIEVF